MACSWTVGFVLAVFFQLAHCVETTAFVGPATSRKGKDFDAHQLLTTANVGCETPVIGRFLAWLMGGLHTQIEHHIAPGIPHTAYPAMAARLRRACAAREVDYIVHRNIFTALRSHTRWLRLMGRQTSLA